MSDAQLLASRIRKSLAQILAHYDETLQPVRRAVGSHVTASREPPPPISIDILHRRAEARERLAYWSWVVIRDRDLHTESLSVWDLPGMIELLTRHADWLGEQDTAPLAARQLEASAVDLRGIAAPHRKEWFAIGTCPLENDSPDGPVICGGQVRAYPEKDPECQVCGVVAVTTWWERAMFTDPELTRLLTAGELVTFIHSQFGAVIKEATIRKWIERNIITRADTDAQGRALYDRGAVAYALERRKIFA